MKTIRGEEVVQLQFTKEQAQSLSHDLSDLLCWWQGFKTGITLSKEEYKDISIDMGDTGIKAALEINLKLKDELKNDKFSSEQS